jgi:hypothetical protein
MGLGHDVSKAVGHALHKIHAGDAKLVARRLTGANTPRFRVTSPAFAEGGPLPRSATVDGDGKAPPLTWNDLPPNTKSVVVVCEDPDAPLPEPYVHWLVYGIAPNASFGEHYNEGRNSRLASGYVPASPPIGHGLHHYHFQVFALDMLTNYDSGIGRSELVQRLKGHVIGFGEAVGTYERK